ncbi:MAG: butyrate kinase [Defluviitaleaceae bacterium]|nr:butyrate kinase [Defluviitaleaceae bacterium]
MNILIINPGSTSTKIGYFQDETEIFDETLRHDTKELNPNVAEQYEFRMNIIEGFLKEKGINIEDLDTVVGMGGLLKPITSGTWLVNDSMAKDLKAGTYGEHASNLGGLISKAIADKIGKKAFIVDPVVVDEFEDISRISGNPILERRSIFHALNQKATAREFCNENNLKYENANLIVVHMGGGVSAGAHFKGRVIDANNALDGDGPFTPERSGGLPSGDLVRLSFSGKYSEKEILQMIKGKGGFTAYFNTNNMIEVEEKAEKDPKAKLVLDAFCYQVAKEIGLLSTVLEGQVDGIILTGGIAYSKYVVSEITKRVRFIAPVKAYPGENELKALALGALRVLKGEEKEKIYE